MRFKSSHFLQNTMGTELEGRCCQPQECTAHCTHMLKTHWFGFMLSAFPGQNPIGHTAVFSVGSPGTPDKRAAGASAARLCASAARAPGEPCPPPNEDCFRLWHNFKCCGTKRENQLLAVNIYVCIRHMEGDQMLNIIHVACAQHRIMRFQKMTCLRQLSLHPQTQRAHSPGTT